MTANPFVGFRVKPEFREALELAAKAERRSPADYARLAVELDLIRKGYLPDPGTEAPPHPPPRSRPAG